MAKSTFLKKILIGICIIISLTSVASFAYRNHKNFYQTPLDFLIFLRAGEVYKESGQLYHRTDSNIKGYADKYHPSAAIYKFPPAFQLMLMPLKQLADGVNLHIFTRLLLTTMYIVSLILLYLYLRRYLKLDKEKSFYFGLLLAIIGSWFMPFFESIRWLLTEIPLLLLFITSFLLLGKNRFFSSVSGALIAYAACAKIYPVFLFGYHLSQKNKYATLGFLIGVIITIASSLYFFGLSEHLFYVKNILPVLLHEQVTDKWVNLNIEKFLFIMGLIPDISGHIFQITRLFFVGSLLSLLYLYRQRLEKDTFLVFSLFITTMFFCFPNYWPQYQIFLIIPISYLLATYIDSNNKKYLIICLVMTLTLFVPDSLWAILLNHDVAKNSLDMDLIGKEAYSNGTSITLLKYSPSAWLAYYAYEFRATVPVVLWILQMMQLIKLQRKF